MALLRNARIETDDWIFVPDDKPVPAAGPAAVTLARYLAERDVLAARNTPLGLVLASDESPRTIAGEAGRFALICLDFPKFTDGRPYSAARLLRERYGFTGELRATGNVLRDQLAFMARCGFDAFEIPDGASAAAWFAALGEISVRMQPAADGPRDHGRVPAAFRVRPAGRAELWAG